MTVLRHDGDVFVSGRAGYDTIVDACKAVCGGER
jgi:hypothetical protein